MNADGPVVYRALPQNWFRKCGAYVVPTLDISFILLELCKHNLFFHCSQNENSYAKPYHLCL